MQNHDFWHYKGNFFVFSKNVFILHYYYGVFKIDLGCVVTTFDTLLVIREEEIFQSADFQSQSSVYLG
jgi:hypothetical protein